MFYLTKNTSAIFLAVAIWSLSNCQSEPAAKECKNFKEGQYKIRSELDSTITLVSRYGKYQVEVKEGKTDTLKMAVVWMDDCRYDLQYLSGDDLNPADETDRFVMRKPIKIKILETTKDYYIFSAEIEDIQFVYKDTAFKAK